MNRTSTAFLIDDDFDDHEIFSYAMEKADENVKCVFANDGIKALEKLNSESSFVPDYIFIDMNMPRMNGQQCLIELKKIERLKDIPVYMYSTSADPKDVEENLKLGAAEFIIKPSNVNDLTTILGRIVRKNILPLLMFFAIISFYPGKVSAQQKDSLQSAKALKKLSVEELMNIVVTSVSKSPEKLSEVASAIQVVSSEEIKRSGTLRLPGALRLASNLQVSVSGAHNTRISSRGFNGFPVSNSSLANKLLVLIDGRSVYTPLFGGVFWDVQNVLQEDIKQIEAISGPGGALWGANAVNGIINVISKNAKETQGVYASAAGGTTVKDFFAARYGSHVDTTLYYRGYVQRYEYYSTELNNGKDAMDAWNITQGGFRSDYTPNAKNSYTLQGDLYAGKENDTGSTVINGQNIIARWVNKYSSTSGLMVQTYFDRTFRNIESDGFIDEMTTYDIDLQHNFSLGSRNKIVWGLEYRIANDKINTLQNDFIPANRTLQLFSGYVQDQIALKPDHLELTLGTKVLHNDYVNVEFHPTIRLALMPNANHTLWGAVSRGVRTPTRFETDHPSPILGSYGDFKSEKVIAYEIGYRIRPKENMYFSIAGFYNQYTDLRSVDTNATPPPAFYFANNLEANTYGVELSSNVVATPWWKLHGGYTWLQEKFTITGDKTYPLTSSFEAIDPQNQFLIQSLMDVTRHIQCDLTFRYVDVLPAAISLPSVPSYFTFDARLAWHYKWATVAVIGSNLAEKTHGSSDGIKVPRSVFVQLTARF